MKKLLLFFTGLLMFISCSNSLSEKYNPQTFGADLLKIEKKVSKEDKELIQNYVSVKISQDKGLVLNGLTYQQILEKAKQEKSEKAIADFYNTKFTDGDKFSNELQEMVDKKYISITATEVKCIGFFCSYKREEGTINNYTYKQIIDEAPKFCQEKGEEVTSKESPKETAKESKWKYKAKEDKMGDKQKVAVLISDDVLEFDFPYDGGAYSSINIRKKEETLDVIYRITKGQIMAANSINGGKVRVKFDEEKPFETRVLGASDNSSDIIFFESPKKILQKIKNSKKMIIEVGFFNEGNRQIEFDVEGLEWE